MNNRDDELDALLKPLREISPSDSKMKKWQHAVRENAYSHVYTVSRKRMVLQMVAAMVVGVIIGGVLVRELSKSNNDSQILSNNIVASATYEQSHTNLD